MKNNNIFVSFEFKDGKVISFLKMDDFVKKLIDDPENLVNKSSEIYLKYITEINRLIKRIKEKNKTLNQTEAYLLWELGNLIYLMIEELKMIGLEIDGIYSHLVRDTGMSKDIFKKVITFRRYVDKKDFIPKTLMWGVVRKNIRKAVKEIIK